MMFRPRAAMLTLYGDYVRYRGVEIGIGSLIKLLGNFGLSEQSVRSAVSRMCRAGLLRVRHNGTKSYYSLTEMGMSMVEEGERRIFERNNSSWNGYWSVVVYYIPEEKREARDKLRQELTWIGYGPLSTATWISPHDPLKMDLAAKYQKPSVKHLLGTDSIGRDILSRLIWGTRVSLYTAVLAISFSVATGILIGVTAGFFGGKVDIIISRFVTSCLLYQPLSWLSSFWGWWVTPYSTRRGSYPRPHPWNTLLPT